MERLLLMACDIGSTNTGSQSAARTRWDRTLAAGIQRGATEEGVGRLTPAAYAKQLK